MPIKGDPGIVMENRTMMGMHASTYAEIGRKLRELPEEKSGPCYEWEELVQKLCASDDAGLRSIGVRELEILTQQCPACPALTKL